MKYALLVLSLVGYTAFAESIDVKGVTTDAAAESSTTIEIKKGKPGTAKSDAQWEVTDGQADVEGESGATMKDARSNWKKSCDDWKKEIREDNKENKVISLNCGTMSCGGEAGHKSCTSKASFKIKTRIN